MSVGSPLPHDTAHGHVTGGARYVDDIPLPANCLHLCFGLSDIARGRFEADLSAVRAAPGVISVLTAAELHYANDVSPSVHDEPLLAEREVFYIGQPLFVVIATSHMAARKAARRARISYEEEPALLTIDDALAANSRYEDAPLVWQKGDALAAVEGAAHEVRGEIEIGGQEHFYLEGQAALAMPGEGVEMHVVSSTQHPTEIQHKVAEALGVDMHQVRVEVRRMGGGFGGKESQGNALAVACALAARATGKPCKMRYDRNDDMIITGKRHDFRIRYRAGFDGRGVLSGVVFEQYARCGWAQDLSLAVADRAMLHADNAYHLPAARIESHRLRTNTQSATAFRGFGGPQGVVGIERVMDHIAHHLGEDPLQVRARNVYLPADAGQVQRTPYGQVVDDSILPEMLERLRTGARYDERRAEIAHWNTTSPVLKKGIALTPVKFGISFTLSHLNQAGALVHVYQDGSVHLNHGGTEMGQGLFRKVAQVAASELGVAPECIRITATDTDKVPNTSATAASSGSDLNGMAVKDACETLRARLAAHMASLHGGKPEEAVFAQGVVRLGSHEMAFADLARAAYQARVSLSATGFYRTPGLEWDRVRGSGRPFFYFAYGAAVSEVVIDTLTGEYRILRADILHDVGTSLNPALDVGQIEGGYVQGAGWLTCEELVWDNKGRLRTDAPSTYKIPCASDTPDIFNVALWEGPNRQETIYRSKAVGEPPFMLGISAFLALSDAVAAAGGAQGTYPALDAPATPERVLMAVERLRRDV